MKQVAFLFSILCPASMMAVTHYAWADPGEGTFAGGIVPTRPKIPAWSANTQYRVVIRIHNCRSGGYLIGLDNPVGIRTDCNSVSIAGGGNGSVDSGNGAAVAFPRGAGDVVMQLQRLSRGNQYCAEAWRLDTNGYSESCSGVRTGSGPLDLHAGNMQIGGGYGGALVADIDYIRWYSATVPLGTLPSTAPGGDMADWEFEQNGNDSSRNRLNLSIPAAYPTTNTYPPRVVFPSLSNCYISYPTLGLNGNLDDPAATPWFCVYTAGPATPLKTAAYSPNQDDSIVTYSWSQADGPTTGTITSPTSQNTTVTGLTQFGQYDFRLSIADREGHRASDTLTIGVVTATGPNDCFVSDVPQNLQSLIGPLTPWGSSCDPWRWYDIAEVANANVLMAAFSLPPSAKHPPNPGRITINAKANPPTITGTGTHFTTDCGGMSFAPNAPNCNGASAWIWWNAEGARGNGRYLVTLAVTDDTHATITSVYSVPGPYSDLQYSIVNLFDIQIPFSIAQNGVGGSYSWNYYDNVIALYRLYYRTGITAYLNYAHSLADAWWIYALDHGYNPTPRFPRLLSIPGMMARAIEGGFSARWKGIENEVGSGPQGIPNPPNTEDVREAGYAESFLGLITSLDPNITANPAQQSTYCGYIASSVNTFWANAFAQGGGVPAGNAFLGNASYPNIGLEVAPFQLVITATGLRDAYLAASSRGCNDPKTAAKARNQLTTIANYIYQYGAMGNRPIPPNNGGGVGRVGSAFFVGDNFVASGETAIWSCNGQGRGEPKCVPGTVSGAAGSTTLKGSGTTFRKNFHCNGTDAIGIIASIPSNVGLETHVVASCASDTEMTLADALQHPVSNLSIHESQFDTYSGSSCAPSKSKYCFFIGGPTPSADLSIDNAGILGWMYQFTGQPNYKTWADDMFSAAFGGPAGGPGTNGPPVGPMSSGQTTGPYGYISALPSCNNFSPPCGGLGLVKDVTGTHPIHWGKDFGLASGWAGAADNFLAYRLMVPSQN